VIENFGTVGVGRRKDACKGKLKKNKEKREKGALALRFALCGRGKWRSGLLRKYVGSGGTVCDVDKTKAWDRTY
jgi:hypothetical protein